MSDQLSLAQPLQREAPTIFLDSLGIEAVCTQLEIPVTHHNTNQLVLNYILIKSPIGNFPEDYTTCSLPLSVTILMYPFEPQISHCLLKFPAIGCSLSLERPLKV